MGRSKRKGSYRGVRIALKVLAPLFLIGAAVVGYLYHWLFIAPVDTGSLPNGDFYISSDDAYEDVLDKLEEMEVIKAPEWFDKFARKKNYHNNVHPGRFVLKDGMSRNDLVDLLRSGAQTPVEVTFNIIRVKADLAGKVTRTLEVDSAEFLDLLRNEEYVRRQGFTPENVLSMFIPDTYEMYWSVSAEDLFERMKLEYERYWTAERRKKARSLGMTPIKVSIIASIVQAEQHKHPDERPIVAGLYLNRLRRGMKLESDPTLVWAIGDFSIERVLNEHKEIDSPYNTYMYKGLPPGPIQLPERSSLNAVLNPEEHNYLFMCAKPDTTGYHAFARTLRAHNNNANRYRRWLNKRGIY